MPARTDVFTKLVGEHMGAPPVLAGREDPCGTVVEKMRSGRANSAVVVDVDGLPVGIVTEQDICRRLAFRMPEETPASAIMSQPVQVVETGDRLFHALAQMRRLGLRHMPVVESGTGRIVGMLEIQRALELAAADMVEQIERLTHSATIQGMARTKHAMVNVARQLFDDATPAPDVQQLITDINNDLYQRVVELCLENMRDSGWGAPPVAFDVMVMGSGGRGENFLHPDQDNGFIIDDYPDAAHDEIDAWFIELAQRMTESLDRVGFPYCSGSVMATNPLWRKTITQWKAQVDLWVGRGTGMVLRLGDIFFDFKRVYGSGALAKDLRRHVTTAAGQPFFLRRMLQLDDDHRVALGPFRHLLVDHEDGPFKGKLDLKRAGSLPLVEAARIGALLNAIPETSTLERINALHGKGMLSDDERDYLDGAFTHITNLVLRQQVRDFTDGRPLGNHVGLDDMTRRERDMLVDGLRAIRRFRKRIREELTGELF
ncbi:MAG: DUF294 nucleotidyltransferase-like domain-containing protein [Arenicellales bacterium]